MDSNALTTQSSFLPDNLPPNTEAFYNSPQFAHNQLQFFSSLVSFCDRAQRAGLEQIKEAIEGLS